MKSETVKGLIPLPSVAGNMGGREDAITSLKCIGEVAAGCGRQIRPEEIMGWDKDTIHEYRQSGWCLACQNRIFSDPEEEFPCTCEFVDVGVGLIPHPMNDYCEQHGERIDQDSIANDYYDPDLREDEPPHDMDQIVWSNSPTLTGRPGLVGFFDSGGGL